MSHLGTESGALHRDGEPAVLAAFCEACQRFQADILSPCGGCGGKIVLRDAILVVGIEWRVVTKIEDLAEVVVLARSENHAKTYAAQERDFCGQNTTVTVEHRYVGPWRSDDAE